nr:MAG TPA: hypothetical protein [Caudoviricetes sp.]
MIFNWYLLKFHCSKNLHKVSTFHPLPKIRYNI